MWDELITHLSDFPSAVLTGTDAEGYPFSVRCRPTPDIEARLLRVRLPEGTRICSGPASLLCHSHDENLWNLKSFLVRGVLSRDGGDWNFEPRHFIAGAGIGGLPAMARFFIGSRRRAGRYLKKRGLARPKVPWGEINVIKKQALDRRGGRGG